MLALLAFAGLPALAQAEFCDATCKEYKTDIPKGGVEEPQHPKSRGGEGSKSTPDKPPQGGGEAESPGTGTENEDEGKQAGGPGAAGDGDGKGPGSGGPGSQRATIAVEDARPVGGASPAAAAVTDHGSGSSPLVPVLIAIAVLAAISFGTVIYRQRRQIPVG